MIDLQNVIQTVKNEQTSEHRNTEEVVDVTSPVDGYSLPDTDEDDSMIMAEVPKDEQSDSSVDLDPMESLKNNLLSQSHTPSIEAEDKSPSIIDGVHPISIDEIKGRIQETISRIGVPVDAADTEANNILTIVTRYRKRLIVEEGLDDIDINEAVTKRLNRELGALEEKYVKGAPVVINVPDVSADKIEFTEAQQRKLDKATKIQLVRVEKKDLGMMKLKDLSKRDTKLKYIQNMNNAYISKYGVPLPLTGEYAQFRGALIIEMLQARPLKNESLYSIAQKKATLAYQHYIGGVNYPLKDDKGITILSYDDFIERFRYADLDMMVYGVACASSGPMTIQDLECTVCHNNFTHEFSLASLLSMPEETPAPIKKAYDDIIDKHTQPKFMSALKAEQDELYRYQSPFTHNLYDIGAPSIKRALSILGAEEEEENQVQFYISSIALFVHAMYLYDAETDEYIEVSVDEYDILLNTLKMLPQKELAMLNELANDLNYIPSFVLKSKCTKCGSDLRNEIKATELVFFVGDDRETAVEVKK